MARITCRLHDRVIAYTRGSSFPRFFLPSILYLNSVILFRSGRNRDNSFTDGIVINISRKRYQGSPLPRPVVAKKETKMGDKGGGKRVGKLKLSRGREVEETIERGSRLLRKPFLQKFRQFSPDSRTLFAKSPRDVLLSSCQFEMWHHSYDLLRRSFGDESVKIASSGMEGVRERNLG